MPSFMRKLTVRSPPTWLPLVALVLVGVLPSCRGKEPAHPDLVLITVDRLAADDLACFGGPADSGLSVCGLAKRGTLFAWAMASGRGEASAMASVLTGLRPSDHGVRDDGHSFLLDERVSVAETLSAAGYATAAFVSSPRVNRSRRLSQGFETYDDRAASSGAGVFSAGRRGAESDNIELSQLVQDWVATARSPWFVWVHADRDTGVAELDRLVSRLTQSVDHDRVGPGILFAGLRGDVPDSALPPERTTPIESGVAGEPNEPGPSSASAAPGTSTNTPPRADSRSNTTPNERPIERAIEWRSHRIPLIWRPPLRGGTNPHSISFRLASTLDVAPTLQFAAGLTESIPERNVLSLDLQSLALGALEIPDASDSADSKNRPLERVVLLEAPQPIPEVGIAVDHHVYVRRASDVDGTGLAIPESSLADLGPRFASVPVEERERLNSQSAALELGPWQGADSESSALIGSLESRLSYHLSRFPQPEPE